MTSRPKLLFILTSHDTLPARDNMKTGWYLPEFVHPYNALSSHVDITIASPKGGEAPVDPYSVQEAKDDALCQEFLKSKKHLWTQTEKLETFLGNTSDFAGVFYVGGHGR